MKSSSAGFTLIYGLFLFILSGLTMGVQAQDLSGPSEGAPGARNQRWVKEGSDILYAFPLDTKVGVGLSNPSLPFEVVGDAQFHDEVEFGKNVEFTGALHFPQGVWTEDGGVGIGTSEPDSSYRLSVNGRIRSKEVVVEADWADFVFEEGYDLPALDEVETFIQANGHLPGIPSEEEVTKEGIGVGAIQAKLLQKIEELTLYSIEQQKKIDKMSQMLNNQKKLIERLSKKPD